MKMTAGVERKIKEEEDGEAESRATERRWREWNRCRRRRTEEMEDGRMGGWEDGRMGRGKERIVVGSGGQ